MSLLTYEKAKRNIFQNEEIADFVGERSNELIKLAEKTLEVTFSGSYLDFIKTFGAGNFGSQEIFGIINSDFENSSVPDAIWYTLSERKYNLPKSLIVIHECGNGQLFCLDHNELNDDRKPKVVVFMPGLALKYQPFEIVASDFGDNVVNKEIFAGN
ncbi:SMI1/KNR4 family protein [Salipaludibacillus sp. LMS25]|jgi:hypothetical protein|uniref:SMI1/KNR4 family protein n=1 Tax=Salipaludibacillus sp. LMS25 TaxID=2924031 RepID=UPI0020D19969|nr:SMI1/KNR4 family protein [Salipaludibacillus sp. LMS25]UTR15712.1 SMI1/KNR4 family protein [Salipaludibacillus sp. LMS25]